MLPGDNPQCLGHPLPNCTVTVRTPSGEEAIPLSTHQLYVSGVNLMRGYLNRPDQPFIHFDGDERRYYPTGDLVQRLPNGEILFIGRVDSQVKVRGYRVELGEVESVLAGVSGVRSARVVLAEGGLDLVAYVVPTAGKVLEAGELREQCMRRLAFYMVPRQFHLLHSMPLTPNAKVDMGRLVSTHVNPSQDRLWPANVPERLQIVEEIAEILGVRVDEVLSAVDKTRGYAYLGGNSLNAQRLVRGLAKRWALEDEFDLVGRLLSPAGTLADFIREVESRTRTISSDQALPTAPPAPSNSTHHRAAIPLSVQQEQFFYLAQLERPSTDPNGLAVYTLPLLMQFHSDRLDIPRLHHAFFDMVQRQTVLRTVVRESREGDITQEVLSLTEAFFPCPDVRALTEVEEELAQRMRAFTLEGLEETGPPIKCTLFKTSHHYFLLVLIHHMACDAYSTGLMEDFVQRRYRELAEGVKPQRIPPLAYTYQDWAIGQKDEMNLHRLRVQLLEMKQLYERAQWNSLDVVALFEGMGHEVVECWGEFLINPSKFRQISDFPANLSIRPNTPVHSPYQASAINRSHCLPLLLQSFG